MRQFEDIYRGRRVLLTGHTGFKGSWLALWLRELGAELTCISLPPATTPNHWDLLDIDVVEQRSDLRDVSATTAFIHGARPEVVFHLAAQALVRRSYAAPLETWSTNVMGTAAVLDACRSAGGVGAIVVVTSDKCYENQGPHKPFRETDALGGTDPYSASKAATEIVVSSFRDAFFRPNGGPLVATGRAGNVIGGGDWSDDRLIPDVVRAISAQSTLSIRSPDSTRPWQHVLESLSGYLLLGQKLLSGDRRYEGAWNFGPRQEDSCTVTEVLMRMRKIWPQLRWQATQSQEHEAQTLQLDSTKASSDLGWRPVWSLNDAVRSTAEWYNRFLDGNKIETRQQLNRYIGDAQAAGLAWSVR